MAAKTYSAGTIFLQVVPVFKDLQRDIRRDVEGLEKTLGDDLEKIGRRAGERSGKAMGKAMADAAADAGDEAGENYSSNFERQVKRSLKGVQKQFDELEVNLTGQLPEQAERDVSRVKKILKQLTDPEISLDMNEKEFLAKVAIVKATMKSLTRDDHTLGIDVDLKALDKDLAKVEAVLDTAVRDRHINLHPEIDTRLMDRSISRFERNFKGAMQRAMNNIQGTTNHKVNQIIGELEQLHDVEIGIDLNAGDVLARAKEIEAALALILRDQTIDVDVRGGLEAGLADLRKFRQEIEGIPATTKRAMGSFEQSVRRASREAGDALGNGINPEIDQIKARLKTLGDENINLDADSGKVRAEIEALQARLKTLATGSTDIQVKAETTKAEAKLAALTAILNRIDGRDIDIRADVDAGAAIAKMGILRALLSSTGSSADGSANAFRSFNVVVLAAATLIPALVPVLGAAGGALLALLPILASVGAGLGALIIGFTGIGDAVSALGDQADNASKEARQAAKTQRAAAYAVTDAKQSLADAERSAAQAAGDAARATAQARKSAADAIENALDRQKDAQEAYRDSVKDVREAEEDLRQARKNAKEADKAEKADTADKIRQNALDIRQAKLAAFDATNTYNTVMADGSSTAYDQESALVAMLQAREALHELRDTGRDLAKDQKKQNAGQTKGAADVKTAQDKLLDAIKDQKDAEEDLADAAKDVADARVAGQQRIADAVRNQQRTEAEGQRSIARAQESLRRAQESYADSLKQVSASADKVATAMSKLGPAGQEFAKFLFGLRGGFYEFRDAIQEQMLPGVQRALQGIIDTYGPQFKAFMAEMGGVVGDFFERFSESLQGPAWRKFFAVMGDLGPLMAQQFGQTTINWLETFASIMTAVAPFAERLSEAMLATSEAVANWAASDKGQKGITSFMEYAAKVGPKVVDFLGAFVGALVNLAKAVAPFGLLILEGLTAFLNFIADMDPEKLGLIVGALAGLILASQLAYGAIALVAAGGAIFASTLGLVIFLVVAIVAGLAVLAIKFPQVRKALEDTVDAIGRAFRWLQDNVFEPVIGWISENWPKMMGAISKAWERDGKPVFDEIAKTVVSLFNNFVKPYFGFILSVIVGVFKLIALAWLEILWPVFRDAIFPTVRFLWTEIFGPVLRLIGALWGATFSGMRLVWEKVLAPVLAAIIKTVGFLWRNVFFPILRAMGRFWSGVIRGMKGAYTNVLAPVFELFIAIVKLLWFITVKPILDAMGKAWGVFAAAFKVVYDKTLGKVIGKFIDAMGGKQGLQSKFETVVAAIKLAWEGLKKIFAAPIKFLLKTVLNDGVIAGFNKIAKFVKTTPIKKIPISKEIDSAYATGGILPGYTPGRDPHKFYSPTGGRLELSGGEAIMRPEVTRAVGSGWVDQMNKAARNGGVNGVRKAMSAQRFWMGGVLPLAQARTVQHKSGYGSAWAGDLNYGSGYDDYGMPVRAWKDGIIAAMRYIGDASYGRWIDVNHPNGQSSRYAHLSGFVPSLKPRDHVKAGQTLGYVGDLGNTGTPPTSHLHFEINGGAATVRDLLQDGGIGKVASKGGGGFPSWLVNIAKDPLGYAKGLVNKPIDKLRERFAGNGFAQMIADVPGKFIGGLKDKITSIIPGPLKDAYGLASDVGGAVVGGVKNAGGAISDGIGNVGGALGFARGGVLPYNGTMMYDQGGYLPPGLTSVVNLTGKPEPVYTHDQNKQLVGAGKGGFTYAPVINGSDLGPEDLMDDLEFTIRKLGRSGGRYEGP